MPDGGAEVVAGTTEGKDGRSLGTSASLKVILFVVVVLAIALLMYHFAYGPMSWGGDGDLELTITLDKEAIQVDGSIVCTYTLTNTGKTDLRILPQFGNPIRLYDANNTSVRWIGPVAEPPRLDDDDLIIIKSGKRWSKEYEIDKDDWDLEANETYKVMAGYWPGGDERVTLPYWTEYLASNEVYFSVDA